MRETGEIDGRMGTPFLVIDSAIARDNIRRVAEYASAHDLKLRPHTKTHKSIELGRMQMEAGATGLTVAKVGEAQVMAQAADDVLMAYPAVDPLRCAELARLASKITLRVAIDSVTAAQALSSAAVIAKSTIGILVDLDVGMHRTGVQSPRASVELARAVSTLPGLRLDGIMIYPGHIGGPSDQQGSALLAVETLLVEARSLWRAAGLECGIVSGGSTPTALQSHLVPSLTEIRPGTYIFYDMNCVRAGVATLENCAARIICTVVSDAVPKQVVLDGGSKTFTSDRCGPAPESGHGHVVEYPQARITKLTEEHAQVDVSACEVRPKVGERVSVIPNHICPCVNLQDSIWWQDGDALRPLKVDARGKLF